MADDKAKTGLVVGALGISTVALVAALRKPAMAAEDTTVKEALAVILTLAEDTQAKVATLLEEVLLEKEIKLLPFSFNLARNQGVTLQLPAPLTGRIKRVTIHWPNGCNALVDVRVGLNVPQFCPLEGFLALNDATPTYPFNVEVKQGDPIWVEMRNTDGWNPHNITVTVGVEGILL